MTSEKVTLITGGGSGMGQLASQNFAKAGRKVAALDVNAQGLAQTAAASSAISTWECDITDFERVRAVVAEVESQLGPIESVYNCAAIMPFGRLLEQDNGIIHKQMAINYGGLVNIAQATLPAMIQRRQGDFVSFASMAGLIPTLLTGAYSSTKAAVAFFTETLYHENRDTGIRFVCVCPPVVNTPLLDQGRESHWPKMLDEQGDPIQPQQVLDAIDVSLAKNEFWCLPGKGTRFARVFRGLAPGLIWKQIHEIEGF